MKIIKSLYHDWILHLQHFRNWLLFWFCNHCCWKSASHKLRVQHGRSAFQNLLNYILATNQLLFNNFYWIQVNQSDSNFFIFSLTWLHIKMGLIVTWSYSCLRFILITLILINLSNHKFKNKIINTTQNKYILIYTVDWW